MRFAIDNDSENYSFVPPTFELPNPADEAKFAAYKKKNPGATFIAKPQVGSQGDAICLFKEMKDLPYGVAGKELIVQRYLDKPLLLNGFKFDLRVYVCIFGLNPLQAFVCEEGLARFCTAKYEAPTKSNYKKAYMHLTNYSINKMSEEYVKPSEGDILLDNDATKRTLTSLYETLSQQGVDVS